MVVAVETPAVRAASSCASTGAAATAMAARTSENLGMPDVSSAVGARRAFQKASATKKPAQAVRPHPAFLDRTGRLDKIRRTGKAMAMRSPPRRRLITTALALFLTGARA